MERLAKVLDFQSFRERRQALSLAREIDIEGLALDHACAPREDAPGRWWLTGPKDGAHSLVVELFDMGLKPTLCQADMSGLEWVLILYPDEVSQDGC